jgi:uncharacterized SAM-binding protein YcdF (DUF218 family)
MTFDPALLLFWLKKLVSAFVQPPLAPLLPIAAGLLLAGRRRRAGLALAWTGLAAALLLVSPLSVGWLLKGLETDPPVTADAARGAQAVVIVGAGKRRYAPEYGGETVNRLALERLRYGARLAREFRLPVLVSGGAPTGEQPEAMLMAATLDADFGVPARWVEAASLDTRQNAEFSAPMLRSDGVQRILLVTHAAHMARARAEFEARGMAVVAAPTAWLGNLDSSDQLPTLLPSAASAYAGWYAVHEWLGLLAARLSR